MAPFSDEGLTTVTRVEDIRSAIISTRRSGATVGLVPTMGALHEGHLSLVDAAKSECDRVVVSIFVNPTQFGPTEDLAAYPRDLSRDLELLHERGAWTVFAPPIEEIYPAGHSTVVDVGSVSEPWEGAARPTHFRGVATVVLKLLLIAPVDKAYFGQKDYQQTLVVKQLVRDLNIPVEIRVCPIVREPDGLARSSRNAYLNSSERQDASVLWKGLSLAEQLHAEGERDPEKLRTKIVSYIENNSKAVVEYFAFLHDGAVTKASTLDQPTIAVIAARVGTTRLIDNHRIG